MIKPQYLRFHRMLASRGLLYVALVFSLIMGFTAIPQAVNATHIVGGDLTYRCLGGNQYEIRLTVRRDCFLGDPEAQFDDPASVAFFDGVTFQSLPFVGVNGQLLIPFSTDDTLNQEFISDCTISGNDVCVQQTTYVDTIQLPFRQNGYVIVYQRCCRNNTIQNIVDPLLAGMSLVTILSGNAQLTCNSSPVLSEYPPIYICVNDSIDFDFSIESDPDGDSVVYELFTPFLGASLLFPRPQPPSNPPYDTVVWNPPYSLNNLLGGVPLQIDRFTGRLTGVPNTIGQFLTGVRIFSYRNDTLIEVISREWQYNIRACRDVPEANYSVNTELNCDGLSLSFIDSSENAQRILWIFDYPNPDSDTSTQTEVTYQYTEEGFYTPALIVTDMDSICFDTFIGEIGVFNSELTAEFDVNVLECEDSIVAEIIDLSVEPNGDFDVESWQWFFEFGDVEIIDTNQNPLLTLDSSNEVTITLIATSENGCTAEAQTTFDFNIIEIPLQDAGSDTIGVCEGDSVNLLSFPGSPEFTWIWEPTTGLDLSKPWDPKASPSENTDYMVTVTDGLCEVTGDVFVVLQELPILGFETFTDCRSLEVEIQNTSIGGFQFEWDFGDGSPPSNENSPTHTYEEPGNYTITLFSADGCEVLTSDVITVSVILDSVEDTSISCFQEPVALNPDGSADDYLYEWSPAGPLSDSTSPNPIASVTETTKFFVTITDAEFPDCSVIDSVNVVVPGDFELQAPTNDSSYCGSPEISLQAGNPDLSYEWLDTLGNVLSTESELVVQPLDTTTYLLVGTDTFGCSKSESITLNPTFFAYELSPDLVICEGEDTVIFVNNLDPNQDLSYQWLPEDLIEGPTDIANPRVIPTSDQEFTVQITNNTLGCMLEETVTVLVSQFDLDLEDQEIICAGDSTILTLTNNDTTNLVYDWNPKESILDGANTATPTVRPGEATVYTVSIENTLLGCTTTDSIEVLVSEFDYDIIPEELICRGDMVLLTFVNNDTTDLSFSWSPTSSIVEGEDTATPKVMPDVTTQYNVLIENNNYGCMTSDSVLVNVSWFDPPFLEIFAEPDTIVANSDEVFTLFTNQDPNLTFLWAGTGIIDDPTLPEITAAPTGEGTYMYSVTVTNEDGCQITGELDRTLTVVSPFCDMRDVFIPNAFSPNGDGENDVLLVYGNFITSIELRIFNRWGEEVFMSRDQNVGWDGTYNGEVLAPDVFGYYLRVTCPPDLEYFTKGNVTLLR